jgi:hypothetical protein
MKVGAPGAGMVGEQLNETLELVMSSAKKSFLRIVVRHVHVGLTKF